MVIAGKSFRKSLPLPVRKQLHDRGGSLLDRAPCHIELRPTKSCAQSPRERNFIRH
jgi:hypothetical protein